jgi:dTDP-4-dehydrorhamnose reductase
VNDSEIIIIGANGQLGTALSQKYPAATKVDRDELDITNRESMKEFNWSKFKFILNAAAYTNVDGAETQDGRVASWQANAVAPALLSEVATKYDITLLHISTDYVFDGTKEMHKEDEDYSPLNVYGSSKAAGDIAVSITPKHYILRTSWVIGEGKNFVRTMISLGQREIAPTVVADQIGRLTFTNELVRAIDIIIKNQPEYGIYNISNGGEPVSWADITRTIFKISDFNLKVTNTSTAEYFAGKDGIAPRPLNSSLDLSKIQSIGLDPKDWQDDLTHYIHNELHKVGE